eukprot:3600124-Amphidinium_carterae.1
MEGEYAITMLSLPRLLYIVVVATPARCGGCSCYGNSCKVAGAPNFRGGSNSGVRQASVYKTAPQPTICAPRQLLSKQELDWKKPHSIGAPLRSPDV